MIVPNSAEIQPAAEFQALPLEFIVSAPLVAAVKAQAVAAQATVAFIMSMIGEDKKPIEVAFKAAYKEAQPTGAPKEKKVDIAVPLLSIVPVPHLRIDSLTTHFKYEVTQTVRNLKETEKGINLEAKTSGLLSWLGASLSGKISSKSTEESTINRSGMLEITVHASEAPMPEGLAKVLSFLGNMIQAQIPG
jgi:hypothetical protein